MAAWAGGRRRRAGVPDGVPRASEGARGPDGEGRVTRPGRVEAAHDLAVRGALRPAHPQGPGAVAEALECPGSAGARCGPARSALGHDARGAHPGRRDLGVPAPPQQRCLVAQRIAAALPDDLLDGHREADPAAVDLARQPQHPDLAQRGEGLVAALVDGLLRLAVGQRPPAPHHRALERDRPLAALRVEVDRPEQRRRSASGSRLAAPSPIASGCSGERRSGM